MKMYLSYPPLFHLSGMVNIDIEILFKNNDIQGDCKIIKWIYKRKWVNMIFTNQRRRSKFLPIDRLGGEIGRRTGLKIQRGQLRVGSIPTSGTSNFKGLHVVWHVTPFLFTLVVTWGWHVERKKLLATVSEVVLFWRPRRIENNWLLNRRSQVRILSGVPYISAT